MTRVVVRAVVAFVVALAARPAPAAAWTCIHADCPVWCGPAEYALGLASVDLGEAATLGEVHAGMGAWTEVSCTSLETSYTGRTDAAAGDDDGESVIGWVEAGWPHGSNAIGVAGPRWNPNTGCIAEADMMMNGVNFAWTVNPGSGGTVNGYSIVLHEGGHYLGLGHSGTNGAAMFPSYGGGVLTIRDDDRAGICTLYPAQGCDVEGCPDGEECIDGACVPVVEPGCDGPEDCAPDEVCDTGTGECEPMPPGTAPLGAPCDVGGDCESGLCATTPDGTVCSATCDPLASGACPAGFYCRGDASDACGTGLCFAGTPGGGALGAACGDDGDCASLLCDANVCASLCEPSGADCPEGFECRVGLSPSCGACKVVGGFGDPCELDEECASELCVEPASGDDPYCTMDCAGPGDCPSGYECRELGSVDLCVRAEGGADGGVGDDDQVRVLEGRCDCSAPGARGAGAPPAGIVAAAVLAGVLLRRRRRASSAVR